MTSIAATSVLCLSVLILFSSTFAQPERRFGPPVMTPPPPEARSSIPTSPPEMDDTFLATAAEPQVDFGVPAAVANPPPPSPSPGLISCTSVIRSLDGTCTSAVDSLLGATERPQFSYGFTLDAASPTGGDRPSGRLISNIVSNQSSPILSRRGLNELVTFIGQFLDHTFISTPVTVGEEFNIKIPRDDPIFADFPRGELRLERSVRARDSRGRQRPINALSSAVDLTPVYGPSESRLRTLRTLRFGLLKTSPGNLLPLNVNGLPNAPSNSAQFFIAGELRVNENPVLTALHTLFLREHNTIARELRRLFPFMNDELLFQNARIVNIAQYQKIIFEEFFPQMTGRRLPRYRGYRPRVDPTISDIFGAMAFRIGHTMVGNQINRRGPGNSALPPIPFTEMFFRRNGVLANGIEPFLRGAIGKRSEEVDVFIRDSLRNFLFTNVPTETGLDLMALNIQRGRDHALPTYNQLRRLFNRRAATSFAQITRNRAVANSISRAYGGDINKVDGIIGLFAEDLVPGASMGQTMLRIWRAEFTRMRDGDRLFFRRRAAYPRILLRSYPRLRRLFRERNTLKRIILENTSIRRGEIRGSVWRARS